MSTVNRATPGDLNPAFRQIANLGIEPLVANLAQQAAAGATVTTIVGAVPAAGTNVGPVNGVTGLKVRRVVFTPIATLTGAATNNCTLNVYKSTNGGARVLIATLTFALGTNATQYVATALTLQAASTLLLGNLDTLSVDQVQAGTGLLMPAGQLQVDCEPIAAA